MIYWFLKTILLGPIIKVVFKPWVEGAENIPEQGGAIFASNHLSFSDSIFLPLVVPRRMTFPAKMEYFTGTGIKGRLTKAFFKGVGQIPIDRSGGQASMSALNSGLKVLGRGELFGIYPEGTRSPDGKLYKGKTGVARMALEAGVPVIPVAMIDTDKAQPTGQKIPNVQRGQVGIRIGKPLDFSRYEGMQDDRYVLRSITDEIMYELMKLSGQEYVDVYASTVKDRIAARAKATVEQARAGLETGLEQTRAGIETARDQAKVNIERASEQAKANLVTAREQIEHAAEQVRGQVEQTRDRIVAGRSGEDADEQPGADEDVQGGENAEGQAPDPDEAEDAATGR
ncbi:1-acyl-sn-glycerol-3-phosphate acyltransferase [Ornithinicoccus hortensis]|uniref:1-acyl-sn-glycerol-3-phosphate acyltransferase n=1 Tax=Ornithinicoccus hortensis TaxID=82346 RepID=A0A542YRG1_9MICO|nr:1-acyl-sn-glycerol-3-phosphate acyltransferase [Ornithinicoccus hortensis]TQL50638.1 1-acyl-sn-glycerol-3-phosphate acyltransferase [Ornithinicoccus hortensis]